MSETPILEKSDIVLVGAGIMSATLGVLLKELLPDLTIQMFETLDGAAQESSNAWNNAGTGHAALCELNYTPMRADGTVETSKALAVNTEFDLSRQLWAYLVKKGAIASPGLFIHPVPHISFVHGAANAAFLKKRHATLTAHHCYEGMQYSEDRGQLRDWIPLVMEGRTGDEPLAATRMDTGSDVDYGALTRLLRQQVAGQRVQIIKRDPVHGGVLEFGTEIVSAADHSLVALLGASPGASTAAWIMLRVIDMCFVAPLVKLRQVIPSYGESLIDNPELCRRVRADTAAVLGLHDISQTTLASAAE
jgi:L-2-hydroxyglutarate oxidase LhgO